MKFTLDVDVPQETAVAELGRILRYWAGNLKHYDLGTSPSETIVDSSWAPVGEWRVVSDVAGDGVTEAGR